MKNKKFTTNKTITEKINPISYRIGMRFKRNFGEYGFNDSYILCQIDTHTVALMNLKTGNRFTNGVYVMSATNITENEFKNICNTHDNEFELIS